MTHSFFKLAAMFSFFSLIFSPTHTNSNEEKIHNWNASAHMALHYADYIF